MQTSNPFYTWFKSSIQTVSTVIISVAPFTNFVEFKSPGPRAQALTSNKVILKFKFLKILKIVNTNDVICLRISICDEPSCKFVKHMTPGLVSDPWGLKGVSERLRCMQNSKSSFFTFGNQTAKLYELF